MTKDNALLLVLGLAGFAGCAASIYASLFCWHLPGVWYFLSGLYFLFLAFASFFITVTVLIESHD